MNKKSLSIFFFLLISFSISGEPEIIPVGEPFYDTNGNLLQAHGGGILKHNGYYYWYGENREGNILVSCYRSTNMKDWEFRNHVLQRGFHSELGNANIERPKVIYNPRTNKFVMWAHKELSYDYSQARAAVAECDTVDGNFNWIRSFRPLGHMSRDCTLYVDDDGAAYFISAADENYDLHIYRLTPDFLDIESLLYIFDGDHREAPACFKYGGTYFLVTSGATGWDPNQGKYSTAGNLAGPWSGWQDIGNSTTYNSQPTYILPIQGTVTTSFLYMGDQWAGAWGGPVNDSRYVWLPININSSNRISLTNSGLITVDTETGEVTTGSALNDPDNVAYGRPASASTQESSNTASNGNDGSYSSRWCAADGSTGQWWRVDLGREYDITEVSVYFEFADRYQYRIEGSSNTNNWSVLVDQTNSNSTSASRVHQVRARTRYVQIVYTGLASARWASHYEFSVISGDTQSTPQPTPGVLNGDVNRDNIVNILDALMIAQYYVGLQPPGFYIIAADVNGDGTVSIVDALLVAQYYVGLIDGFPG